MIKVTRAKVEGRKRDTRRRRVLMQIGRHTWLLTPVEALELAALLHEAASQATSKGIRGESK